MKSQERILLPFPQLWKYARMIQRDNAYVVQSRWNESKLIFEEEMVFDISTTICPSIQAVVCYCGTLCDAICKKLRKRPDYRAWVEENRIQEEEL